MKADNRHYVAVLVWVLWTHTFSSDGNSYNIVAIYDSRTACQMAIPEKLVRDEDTWKKLYRDVVATPKLRGIVGRGDPRGQVRDEHRFAEKNYACLPETIDPRPRFQGDGGLGFGFPLLE